MAKSKLLNILGSASSGDGITRRDFLKVAGAASAVGVAGCADSPRQSIFSEVNGDPLAVQGVASWFSSTCTECSAGCGIRVRVKEGRAVKVEGNPESPINKGGLCAAGQSSLQNLYDPDRVREPLKRTPNGLTTAAWQKLLPEVAGKLVGENKVAILTGEVSGTQKKLIQQWAEAFNAEHVVYDPLQPVALAKATEAVFGEYGIPEFNFSKAEVILNFGADFLETWISPCGFARDWAAGRKAKKPLRVIHVEPRLSLTGANADKWISANPGSELDLALAVLKLVSEKRRSRSNPVIGSITAGVSVDEAALEAGIDKADLLLMAENISKAGRKGLVIAGGSAAAGEDAYKLQLVVALINHAIGAYGETFSCRRMRKPETSIAKLEKLIDQMKEGKIDTLIVAGANPMYSVPVSFGLKYAIRSVRNVVVLSSKLDETAKAATYVLPIHTSLESWGDREVVTGVSSFLQPSMSPVFNTKQLEDVLLELAKLSKKEFAESHESFESYVKASWEDFFKNNKIAEADTFESFWRKSLDSGVVVTLDIKSSSATLNEKAFDLDFKKKKKSKSKDLSLLPYASVKTFDGGLANRPWLQELPDPITQLVWDVWAEIHPDTAKKHGLNQGDVVQVNNKYGQLNVPVYLTPFVHKSVVAVPMGGGHTSFGRYAEQIKGGNVFNCLPKLVDENNGLVLQAAKVKVSKGRGKLKLVNVQGGDSQGNRHIAQFEKVNLADTHAHDDYGHHHHEFKHPYEQRIHPVHRWGMAVDLSACTGCSACVVACNAENNIPMVGKKIVGQGREMSWLRIERYFDNPAEELHVSFIPMMCQHCNNAPCEPVCPVYATYHNEEGLNAMIYNRCVGTRYCSNNCSYKVRRFNWFEYELPDPLSWQLNPDVTRRTMGVMEKCTFCVQRIAEVKDLAKNQGRAVKDGEVKPACVQSCPTEALVFGDLNDPNSKVSRISKDKRAYKVLDHHLNTQPAVSYLTDVKYEV